ncbi:MFS transporter [Roseateles sp.]|uniref:MFS transporter n=1 Tax=Roseateles sp. TaxID=1971397 RepID=UPI0025FAE25D|nr:MFS transporter [Roseateles sp.]
MSGTSSWAAQARLLAVVVLAGLSLRPFMTGIGPLAVDIGAQTGLGLKGLALLTLVPMLLMGLFAFAGPSLQARFGARRTAVAALALLVLGGALRLFAARGWQMVGTAVLLGLGAALVQALLPGVIKRQFPHRAGMVTGLYSAMLMGGGALGAQLAPVVAGATGDWRQGLAWTALPAALALVLAARYLPRDGAARRSADAAAGLLGRPRVWLLMACFGLVNGGYSSVVAWLAPFYREQGWTATASGGLLASLAAAQACAALLLPVLAGRDGDRRPWLWLTSALQAAGFAALAWRPGAAPVVSALLLGAGLGGCFALSMVVALEHLGDPARAGALSALMQGGGFLAGWLMHLGCVAVVAWLYGQVSPRSYAAALPLAQAR